MTEVWGWRIEGRREAEELHVGRQPEDKEEEEVLGK